MKDDSFVELENSAIQGGKWGLAAIDEARLHVLGSTMLYDCLTGGVLALLHATVMFKPTHNGGYFEPRIMTESPRRDYTAMTAKQRSTIAINNQSDPDLLPHSALLKILKLDAIPSNEYYGVKLESMSMLTGANNVLFSDPEVNDGEATVAAERQVILSLDEGTVVVE